MHKNNHWVTLAFAILFSLPLGLIGASMVATFQGGFSWSKVEAFDMLAFWRETPFVRGIAGDVFLTGLKVMAGVSAATVAIVFAIVMHKKIEHHGTAQWADFRAMAAHGYIRKYRKITGPIFGKTSGPRGFGSYLTNGDQPHSLVVAPTRAGKGVGVVIPTLLTFDGSIVALDVKGELFEMTSRARVARGDRVYKFSPLDRAGKTHCYNPVLDIVAAPVERRFLETRRLAANLIVAKGKGSEGFIDGARDLFVAGVLACIERGMPTIGAVYDLFALPGEKYKLFAQLAEESQIPEVKRIFDNMASNDTKIITSYTSVLGDGGLNLWADQLIKTATATTDFSIYDLRRDPTSIFIVVSPNDLEVIAPLVRLFFQQLVSVLQRDMPKKDETFEVLFLLDEFKHLGKLEAIETAITTIAGYKGRFMFIIQSLAALTASYEQHGKENFLGNTGVQVFMATADDETPQYISKAIGDYTYLSKSKSWGVREMLNTNVQQSYQGAALIRPEQIRMLDDDTQIVLIKGHPPLKMPKVKFYADRVLKRIFESQKGPLPEPVMRGAEAAQIVLPIQGAGTQSAPAASAPDYSAGDFEVQSTNAGDEIIARIMKEKSAKLEEADAAADAIAEREQTHARKQGQIRQAKTEAREALAKASAQADASISAQERLLAKIIALQTKTATHERSDGGKGVGI